MHLRSEDRNALKPSDILLGADDAVFELVAPSAAAVNALKFRQQSSIGHWSIAPTDASSAGERATCSWRVARGVLNFTGASCS